MIHLPWTTMNIDGVETSMLERGSGSEAVVLLHGGIFGSDGVCTNAAAWEMNLDGWGDDRRVIALDLLGNGRTAGPLAEEDFSYEGIVAHLKTTLSARGVAVAHLVGHDQGALIALRLAMDSPELVASLTIVNSPSAAPSGDAVPNVTLVRAPQPAYGRASQAWILNRQSWSPHHLSMGRFLDTAEEIAASERFASIKGSTQSASVERLLLRSALGTKTSIITHLRETGVSMPVMMVWGTNDPMSSASYVSQWGASRDSNSAIAYAQALFNLVQSRSRFARLNLIPNAGYMPFRERPLVFNEYVSAFIRAVK